jgi:hypothetical protein
MDKTRTQWNRKHWEHAANQHFKDNSATLVGSCIAERRYPFEMPTDAQQCAFYTILADEPNRAAYSDPQYRKWGRSRGTLTDVTPHWSDIPASTATFRARIWAGRGISNKTPASAATMGYCGYRIGRTMVGACRTGLSSKAFEGSAVQVARGIQIDAQSHHLMVVTCRGKKPCPRTWIGSAQKEDHSVCFQS